MNWIKGNGLIAHCTRVLVLYVVLQTLAVNQVLNADTESNGKPIYAIEQKNGSDGQYKWFSAYYNYSSEITSVPKDYNVYSPLAATCTIMGRMSHTTSVNGQFRISLNTCSSCYYTTKLTTNSWNWYSVALVGGDVNLNIVSKITVSQPYGTYYFYHNNFQIPLANHIRLDNESDTGTTTYSKTYTIEPSDLGQVQVITIPIRSFLTNNEIKVKMTGGDVNQFRAYNSTTMVTSQKEHVLLANTGNDTLCGIRYDSGETGSGDYVYKGSSTHQRPGDASLLDIPVYFYPTGAGTYTAKFQITSGTLSATATISVTVVSAKPTDLYPNGTYSPNTSAFNTTSDGKPYYYNNCWYSLYHSGPRTLQKRTITDLTVYSPCKENLEMTFDNNKTNPNSYKSQRSTRTNAALFAVGLNKELQYTSSDFNDNCQNNDGTKNYVWEATNLNSLNSKQTIVNFETTNYTSYKDKLYNVQIYNAIGLDVDVSNINLKLDTHVRIDNGTTFGTDDFNISCNKDDNLVNRSAIYVGDTQTNTFKLRSFLTNHNLYMKVVSDEDDVENSTDIKNIFKLKKGDATQFTTDPVPIASYNNICGYPGAGNATSSSSSGTPINTSLIPITVQYCPDKAETRKAKLIFYDVYGNDTTVMATVHLTGQATAGTLTFDNGSGDGNWFTASNWKTASGSTSTKYPGASDDVLIAANCSISSGNGNALCNNMTFATTGSPVLTINADATLKASGSITSVAENILLKAGKAHSASVLFTAGNPKATVECFFRGKSTETVKPKTSGDGNDTTMTPEWQYRGFIGKPDDTGWPVRKVLVYAWNESANGWVTGTDGKGYVTKGSSWTGYSMGNTTKDTMTLTYTTELIPTNQDTTLTLTKLDQGLNLVTNSFSAPVKIKNITFTNVNSEIAFFKTNTYKNVKDTDNKTSLYVIFPQETGQIATVEDNIPAGASFFCLANAANPSITLKIPVAEASGEMYAPRHTEDFNVLKIYAESDSESDEVYLVESDNCSHNYDDGYDGTKFLTDGMGQIYGTNSFGKTYIAADSSMLGQMIGFKAGSNDMTYRLRFDTERLSGYDELYLYDRVTKQYVNILEGSSYYFTGSTEGEDERFQIIGRMEDSDSFITGSDHAIEVISDRALLRGFDGEDETIYMTDLAGKVVWSDNAKNGPWFELPTNIASGLYVIHCGDAAAKYLKR